MINCQSPIFQSFPYPETVQKIIFSDFDETYMPFDSSKKDKSGIPLLEKFMEQHANSLSLLFGWISGSNPAALLKKSEGYVTRFPHFIAGSLGSELYWVKNGELVESIEWNELIKQSGYSKEKVSQIIEELRRLGICMERQTEDFQGVNKETYYYRISPRIENDFKSMEEICREQEVKLLYSKCNPATGDPADCYDVDFLPACCGKGDMVEFISRQFQIEPENRWAFGDSCNDIQMLRKCGNAYLTANADPAARAAHPVITNLPYCHGILEVLTQLI